MSKQAGDVIDTLMRRVYGYGGVAHSETFLLKLLTSCQRVLNCYLKSVIAESTLTTIAHRTVYRLPDDLPDCMTTVSAREGTRKLHPVKRVRDFNIFSRTWFRDTGTRFESYCQLGFDYFFLYPAKTTTSSVTVRYVKRTATLVERASPIELPDELVGQLVGLAELILHARDRRYSACMEGIKEYVKQLGIAQIPLVGETKEEQELDQG